MNSEPPPKEHGYRARIFDRYGSAFKGVPGPAEAEARCRAHAVAISAMLGRVAEADRPARVLELGCGPGTFLWWARARGIERLEGVDVSREMVNQAQSLQLPALLEDARTALGARAGLDWIVALDFIEHLHRDAALEILDLCFLSLREGGRLLLSTPNGAAWRPGPVTQGDLTHETIFTPATIRMALNLAGFGSVVVTEIPPPAHGPVSFLRRLLWMVVRRVPWLLDRIETGGDGGGVYTRVMFAHAKKG